MFLIYQGQVKMFAHQGLIFYEICVGRRGLRYAIFIAFPIQVLGQKS